MIQQQEAALLAAFRQLSPRLKELTLRSAQSGAKRCAEREAAAKKARLRLIVNKPTGSPQ